LPNLTEIFSKRGFAPNCMVIFAAEITYSTSRTIG
jgi:hypothetical protein